MRLGEQGGCACSGVEEFREVESVGATIHARLATRSRRCGAVGQTLLQWQTLTLCSG
jgi:hypothetical protein